MDAKEYNELWAQRAAQAQGFKQAADLRELSTLAQAYEKAYKVANFFTTVACDADGPKLRLLLRLTTYTSMGSNQVNEVLNEIMPKPTDIAESIWCQCNEAIKKAHDDNTTLVMENLRTMGIALPKSIA